MVLTNSTLSLSATKDAKAFELSLDLYGEIEPDESSWREAAVGRVIFTVRKRGEQSKWPSLLAEGTKKPQNMHMWFDKQEEFADEMEELEEKEEKAREGKEKKEKSGKSGKIGKKEKKERKEKVGGGGGGGQRGVLGGGGEGEGVGRERRY